MKLALEGEVRPLRVLLVVAQEDERAERIRAWLAARGSATDVTTYSTVDLATADAHDVVIAGKVLHESRVGYVPTPEGLEAWLAKNLPYVFSGRGERHASERYGNTFEVDVDVKALGTATGERASLEAWLRLAASTSAAELELGQRLLTRYVDPAIAPASWDNADEWYAKWRERIVFVDSAGFWWLEDPTHAPR